MIKIGVVVLEKKSKSVIRFQTNRLTNGQKDRQTPDKSGHINLPLTFTAC